MGPRLIPHWLFPLAAVCLALVYVGESHAANGTFGKWNSGATVPTGCALTDSTLNGVADALISCANSRSTTHEFRRTGCSAPSNGANLMTQTKTYASETWSACANHSGFVVANWTCSGTQTRVYDVNTSAGVLQACAEPGPPPCDTDTQRQTFQSGWDTNGDGQPDEYAPGWCVLIGECGSNVDGCEYQKSTTDPEPECFYWPDAPTKIYCTINVTGSGENASSGPTPDTPNPASPCPSSHSYGTVNGIPTCVPGSPAPGEETPTAPTTTTTTSETVDNGDGTSTTTTTTTNPGGGTTVTSTTTDNTSGETTGTSTTTTSGQPGGGAGSEGQTEQAQFCRDNPSSPLCVKSSWGGSCSAFTCKGDSVQCAIAREQHTRNCALYDTTTALSDLGNAAVAGTDDGTANNPASAGNREETALTSVIDQTRWLSSTCPAPISFTLNGNPISFDLTDLCDVLSMIGTVAVAIALISAVIIVGVF